MWKPLCWIVLVCVSEIGCRKQELPVISPCELLQNIPKYRGKLTAVRGVYWNGLREPQCPSPLEESGRSWPAALFLADSSFAATVKMPVPFETDRKTWDALDAVERRESRLGRREEIWATFVGVLQTRDPEGGLGGFGHLGAFPAQFVVKNTVIGTVSIEPNPTYEYKTSDRRHL